MADNVFSPIYSSGAGVFDYEFPYAVAGTTYNIDLVPIVQEPVLNVALTKVKHVTLGPIAVPMELTVAKSLAKSFSFTVTPSIEIWSATTLLGIGEFVVSPTMVLGLRNGTTIDLTQTPELSVETQFISGSAHSTFQKNFNFTVNPQLTVGRGSQTYFDLTQIPQLEVSFDAYNEGMGTHTYGVPPLELVQTPQIEVDLAAIILPPVEQAGPQGVGWHKGGRRHGADWMLEPIVPERRREPTTAELRKAARDAEQVARRRAAAAQRQREEAQIKAAEAEVERVRGMLSQLDLLDAATRPDYEQQIQSMMQQQQAAVAEIVRLRAELQQMQQGQVEQSNEQKALMLLLAE